MTSWSLTLSRDDSGADSGAVTGADSGSGCAGSLNQLAMDSFPLARRSVVFVSPNVGSNPTLSTALLTTGASFR